MSCSNFNGITCLRCYNVSWLYILIGIVQVVVLILQIYGVAVELNKCDHNNTETERVIANWAAWTNGISLILCGVWAALKRNSKTCSSILTWLIKILWIGTTLVSVLFSAISTGHMLRIDVICKDENGNTKIDAKTVLDTTEAILVLWFVLLALGHMGAKMTKKENTNDATPAAVLAKPADGLDSNPLENGENELFFRGNKHNTIKF